jgi:hypothetical protein
MKKYFVNSRSVKVSAGEIIELNPEQARRRGGMLSPLGENRYKLLIAQEFKRGEVFGYGGQLPKSKASQLLETEADLGLAPLAEIEPELEPEPEKIPVPEPEPDPEEEGEAVLAPLPPLLPEEEQEPEPEEEEKAPPKSPRKRK